MSTENRSRSRIKAQAEKELGEVIEAVNMHVLGASERRAVLAKLSNIGGCVYALWDLAASGDPNHLKSCPYCAYHFSHPIAAWNALTQEQRHQLVAERTCTS